MEKALRFNDDKPELHYILWFPKAIEALARVKERGAIKYGYGNFALGGKSDQEYLDSAMRHIFKFFQGEMYDQESGCQHIAHAIWNLMSLIDRNYNHLDSVDPNFDVQELIDMWKDTPKRTVNPSEIFGDTDE